MKVILLQDIAKIGKRHEVVEVADGYAMNVLIKGKKAIMATPGELTKIRHAKESKDHKLAVANSIFLQAVELVKQEPVLIPGKKSTNGHLFAAISKEDVVDAIFARTKLSLNPAQVVFAKPIKETGDHTIQLKDKDTVANIQLRIS